MSSTRQTNSTITKELSEPKTTDLNNLRNAEWKTQLKEIGSTLNREMEKLNREAIDTQITSPTISFNAAKSYRFTVPNDGGTHQAHRGKRRILYIDFSSSGSHGR